MSDSKPNVAAVAASFFVHEQPIKTPQGAEYADPEKLAEQARIAVDSLVPVDYSTSDSTCVDERLRVGVSSGEARVEPRPSVVGGSDVYALAIGELTGFFGEDDDTAADARLGRIVKKLNDNGIRNGGHKKCTANGAFVKWMGTISSQPEYIKGYMQLRYGESYDDDLANEVVAFADGVIASGRYTGWSEEVLPTVLGKDEADAVIEVLAEVDHEGRTLVRNHIQDSTVDQNTVYVRNKAGEGIGLGSFVNDEKYCDKIENIMTSDHDAVHKKKLAEYAREAILAAVAAAVPNEELYQIDILPSAA